jgi:hypothetical protein
MVCVCICMFILHEWLLGNETDAVDEDLIEAMMRLLKELPVWNTYVCVCVCIMRQM